MNNVTVYSVSRLFKCVNNAPPLDIHKWPSINQCCTFYSGSRGPSYGKRTSCVEYCDQDSCRGVL